MPRPSSGKLIARALYSLTDRSLAMARQLGVAMRHRPQAPTACLAEIVAFLFANLASAAAIAVSIPRSSSESPTAMANSLASCLMS